MTRVFSSRWVPLALLGALLVFAVVTIFTQAQNYGITIDEPLQASYGHNVLAWYISLGKDRSFLTAYAPDAYMPQHGGIFDAVVDATQHALPVVDHWYVRRIVTGLSGLIGIVAIALCGFELGGYWFALLAALGLWLYPRYYGAIYNNPKDVPAAVAMTFILWAALKLIKQWGQGKANLRNSALVGFFIGLSAAIRVNAIIWYIILVAALAGWWLLRGKIVWQKQQMRAALAQQGVAAVVIGLTSWLTMIALWPYIFLSPVRNLLDAITVLSHYPWNGNVLFGGEVYPATQLPMAYVPIWLVIGSPPALVIFALLGLGIACAVAINRRAPEPGIALVVLSFIVPFAALIGLHAVLYDGLRQFLFLIPSLILLAVYGFLQSARFLWSHSLRMGRWSAVALAALTLGSYALVVGEMLTLSPFEYAYFSPIVGGLAGANGRYDTDYWATCSTQSARWLANNYQNYTDHPAPTVAGKPFQDQIAQVLPANFAQDSAHPDFLIAPTRDNDDQLFPTYTIIHTVAAENVPLCVVKVNSALAKA